MLYWTWYMKEVYLYRWRADSRLIGPCYSTLKSYLCVVKPDCSLTDIRIHTGHSASYRYMCICILDEDSCLGSLGPLGSLGQA